MNHSVKTAAMLMAVATAPVLAAPPPSPVNTPTLEFQDMDRVPLDNSKALSPADLSAYPPPLPPKTDDTSTLEDIANFLEKSGQKLATEADALAKTAPPAKAEPTPQVAPVIHAQPAAKIEPVAQAEPTASIVNFFTASVPDGSAPPVARKQPAPPSATAAEYDVLQIYSSLQKLQLPSMALPAQTVKTSEAEEPQLQSSPVEKHDLGRQFLDLFKK